TERGKLLRLFSLQREAKHEAVVPTLISLLKDPEVKIRRAAAETLGGVGLVGGEAAPALREALRDADELVRVKAAGSLYDVTGQVQPSLQELRVLLRAENSEVRRAAVDALPRFRNHALPELMSAVKDPDPEVRRKAATALVELGTDATPASSVL